MERGRETESFQNSLFNPTLDNSCSSLLVLYCRRAGDNRSVDNRRVDSLRSVDNLLRKGNPKSNVDGSNTREMVSLQGHLGSPLTNQLGADGTHRGHGLYPGLPVVR